MKLEFHPEAEEEFLEVASYYEDRFPYYLIYSISSETVYILAIAHERRKPGYWETRRR